jgi:hypothetical protein
LMLARNVGSSGTRLEYSRFFMYRIKTKSTGVTPGERGGHEICPPCPT